MSDVPAPLPTAEKDAPVLWGQKCGAICPACGGCDWLRHEDGTIPDFGSVCVRCGEPEPTRVTPPGETGARA